VKRKLSIILCVVCLTLLPPLGFFWLNSHGFDDEIEFISYSPKHDITLQGIGFWNGKFFIGRFTINGDNPMTTQPSVMQDLTPGWRIRHINTPGSQGLPNRNSVFGFAFWDQSLARAYLIGISAPCWFLALLPLIYPGLYFRSIRIRRNRVRNNLCISCGYDLRESPERCPECGLLIAGNPA
jgi:hypothetical protein